MQSQAYRRPHRPAPPRHRPPTILVIRGQIHIVADNLHEEIHLRPLADAIAELLELDQAEPAGRA